MDGWLDYSLADFLLFAPSTYWRLFEQMNKAVWPLGLVAPAVLAGLAVAAVQGWRHATWAVGVALAISWAGLAHLFHGTYYVGINWAVAWIIPLVWAQAILILALAPGLRFERTTNRQWPAYGVIALAITYPVVGLLAGRPLAQAEIAGLAPDPTSLLTIGLVASARPTWRVPVLLILPVGWSLFSAATLYAMEEPTAWVIAVALPLAVLTVIRRA